MPSIVTKNILKPKRKKKKKYYYVDQQGQRQYVTSKKQLPYKVRVERGYVKKKKLSEKEKYKRKVEASRKRSEALKKYWQSEEGKKKREELSRKAKERARRNKEREPYPMSGEPVAAFTALDRLREIVEMLPNVKYGDGKGKSIDLTDWKNRFKQEIAKEIAKSQEIDYSTGEIISEDEEAFNKYLEKHIELINRAYTLIIISSRLSEIVFNLELIEMIITNNEMSKDVNTRLTELKRMNDIDFEGAYDEEDREYLEENW